MAKQTKQTEKNGQALSVLVDGNITVMREVIKDKNGKEKLSAEGRQLFKYFVRGNFRGRTIEAQFDPKDVGGYEPLDILFDMPNKPVLVITENEITDEKGKTNQYTSYTVQAADENGEIFDCGVVPHGNGNKSLLKMILSGVKSAA